MNKTNKIGLNECHSRLLDIAKHFHAVCEKNEIPYYMVDGTMLGAIRHKGFIPWDDDMDFAVPRKYYNKLLHALENSTYRPYRVISSKNSNYPLSYIKIEDTSTWIDDPRRKGKDNLKIGINIDIFPLDDCSLNPSKVKPYIRKKKINSIIIVALFLSFLTDSWKTKIIQKLAKLIYGSKDIAYWLNCEKSLVEAVNKTGDEAFINLSSIYGERDIINKRYYGIPKLYDFEDTSFYGVDNYDVILRKIYGAYMKLPPENERFSHSIDIYEIDNF